MTPGTACPDAVGDFRVVSEHIGTRDLVQEYLANRERRKRMNSFGCLIILS
jgi:hypothetical protein